MAPSNKISGDALEDDFYQVGDVVYEDVRIGGKERHKKSKQPSAGTAPAPSKPKENNKKQPATNKIDGPAPARVQKRKMESPSAKTPRDAIPSIQQELRDPETHGAPAAEEKKKKKRKKRRCITEEDRAVPCHSAQELEAYLWQRLLLDYRESTDLERADLEHTVKVRAQDLTVEPMEQGVDFADYLKTKVLAKHASKVSPEDSKEAPNGQPRVLIVTSSAIRAVDLVRKCRTVTERPVAKLFAKHMKVSEQLEFLRNNAVDIAVGTPHRIEKLQQPGEHPTLLDRVQCVLVDGSFRDQKQRTLFDIPECRRDWFQCLLKDCRVLQRVRDGQLALILC